MMDIDTTRTSPVVVNCDATVQPDQNGVLVKGIGYVVRNHNGRMLEHDGRLLGAGDDTVDAEVQAMKEAVMYAESEDGVDHVIVRTDCDAAVTHVEPWERQYDHGLDYCSFESVPREQNTIADHFARCYFGELESVPSNRRRSYAMTD